jgi:hypothetical protein
MYQYDKYFSSPTSIYNKMVGYDFDRTTKLALDKALKVI